MTRFLTFLIRLYQTAGVFPSPCRFSPSCSEYAREALERYGWGKGTLLAVVRLLRCHPFHPGGFDPVR